MQRITPYLLYEDAAAAVDWLVRAFGFTERTRFTEDDGRTSHAELVLGDAEIMLGQPEQGYASPKRSGVIPSVLIHVYVDDVDAHFATAKEAGASLDSVPEDQFYGDRRYDCSDLEGQRWTFAQKVRDVPPEEWARPT